MLANNMNSSTIELVSLKYSQFSEDRISFNSL